MSSTPRVSDDATIDAIRLAYDTLPYRSDAFSFTHPSRLGAIGQLYGLDCVLPRRSRVLEIGCASGGNLLPMALGCPEASFVGVDLSSKQIDTARRTALELDIRNVRFIAADVRALPTDLDVFDYIICHGVYSWVPREVKQSILRVSRSHLADGGAAMISFNAYPGWHQVDRLRTLLDAAVVEAGGSSLSPLEAVEAAKSWAKKLTYRSATDSGDALIDRTLRSEAELFLSGDIEYLYHEFLNRVNEPERISEFLADAHVFDLQYVADAHWLANGLFDRAEVLLPPTGPTVSRGEREVLVDSLLNTRFRHVILCRASERIATSPLPNRLDSLHVACRFSTSDQSGVRGVGHLQRAKQFCVDSNGQTTQLLFPAAIQAAEAIMYAAVEDERKFGSPEFLCAWLVQSRPSNPAYASSSRRG
jgi:SAM-dependent methyltransferase